FSSNVTAAKHELIQAENDARNTFQKIIGDMDSIRKKYRILYDAWGVWSNSSQGQLDTYLDLLERLRGKGEMSISDYLLQLQQRLDTKVAGQKTHGQVWVTWVTWLTYSGQMEGWLNTAKEEK
ncbi:MAG: TolC family protein, partial [Magnetococcales bacterium]|nr:TolC family protein [Magnetococcales bacterium]